MAVKFANNVSTTLSSAINATQTTISVADASGLPTLSSGDYVYLTIDTDTASPTLEVVKVTAISSNSLTVVRGQDGTTASSFSSGTKVELRVTAAALDDISSAADTESVSISGDTMTGNLTIDYTGHATGDAGLLVTNDASDWGVKIDKDGSDTYGLLVQADGTHAIMVRSSSGAQKALISGTGNADFEGTLTSGAITADGGGNQSTIKSSSDAPLIVESTDAFTGILFTDTGGSGYLFYGGANNHLYTHNSKFSVAGSTIASGYEFQVNGDANFTGNISGVSGHVSGKFAVKSTGVHASYDFYNNGTSYFNGTTEVNAELKVSSSSAYNTHLNYQDNGQNYISQATSGGLTQFRNSNGSLMEIAASGNVTIANDLTVSGNFSVLGTTTTLNTATLQVEDKNITLNYGTGDTSGSADGAGITIQDAVNGSTDAAMTWNAASDFFNFSHKINAQGDVQAYNFYGQDYHVLNSAGTSWHEWATRANDKVTLNVSTITSAAISATGNSTITGSGSSSNALNVYRGSDGASALRVLNTGEVLVSSNYFYVNASQGAYFTGDVRVRGGISNDGSNYGGDVRIHENLSISGDATLNKTDGFMYLSNIGTGNSGIYVRGIGGSNILRSHSTGSFRWEVNGAEEMALTTNYLNVNGYVRGDNFSDRNNTAYYVDPASDSKFHAINFDNTAVTAPTTTNATAGARLNLYPQGSGRDYSIGIESSNMWFNTDGGFKWYEDGNARMQMETGGHLNLSTGNLKMNGTAVLTGNSLTNINNATISGTLQLGSSSTANHFTGHYYHNKYSNGNIYVHYYPNGNTGNHNVYFRMPNGSSFRYLGFEAQSMIWQGNLSLQSGTNSTSILLDNTSDANYDVLLRTAHDYDGWFRVVDGAGTVQFSVGKNGNAYIGGTGSSGNKIWHAGNDGSGSTLDADLLDGQHASDFMSDTGMANNADTYMNFRVIRNNNSSSLNDGMYIGYANSNSGLTRLFGGGATNNGLYVYSDHSRIHGSTRSPIYYDSSDTSRYIDPANGGFNIKTGTNNQVSIFTNNSGIKVSNAEGTGANDLRLGAAWGREGIYNSGALNVMSDSTLGIAFIIDNTEYSRLNTDYLSHTSDMRAPLFYDTNNTAYYTDPHATSRMNVIHANSYAQAQNSIVKVMFPHGGSMDINGSPNTGAFKIALPVSWTNTMMSLKITVYDYSSHESFEVHCGGYNHTNGSLYNGSWHSCFAYIDGSPIKDRNFTVRFGHDGTKCCIQIGETTSTWSYVDVTVTEFLGGHSNDTVSNWDDGWAVTLVTSNIDIANGGQSISQTDRNRYLSIMYDVDNTGYLLDPAGTSRTSLTHADYIGIGTANNSSGSYRLNMGGDIDMNDNEINYLHRVHFNDGTNFYGVNTTILDFKSGHGTNSQLRFKNSGGTVAGSVYGSSTSFGLLDADSNWAIKHERDSRTGFFINNAEKGFLTGAQLTHVSSVRAPVFYDSNDTARYVDPHSTSQMTHINMNNGNLTGVNYITINDPGPTEGISWAGGNNWKIVESPDDLTTNSGGNFQFVQGSTRRMTLDTSGNFHIPSGSARAELFYDVQNTSYYVDPASTSVLNAASFAGDVDFNGGSGALDITHSEIRSAATSNWQGNPGANGKIQYHSNRWYIVGDSSSNRIVQFRRDGSDKSYIDNDGRLLNAPDARAPIYYDSANTTYYADPCINKSVSLAV